MTYGALPEDAVKFRTHVIERLVIDGAAGYITDDSFAGRCPVCCGDVVFCFHGCAMRVEVRCLDGCPEREIGARLGLREAR